MASTSIQIGALVLTTALLPVAAQAMPTIYRYAISSQQFGAIGTYVRSADTVNGLESAQSKLRIVVRVLGIPVYREQADESETWRDGHLVAFESRSTTNAKNTAVHGELHDGRLEITTARGTKLAPFGTVAADPWLSRQLGPATVVTIKTGEIMKINITGGETEKILVNGTSTLARHYHVNTAAQPNWWEIWLDAHNVPVRFRNLEHGRTVDFAMLPASRAVDASGL